MLLSLVFTRVFFNGSLKIENWTIFTLSFLLMIVSFICIALVISPIFTLSKNARALMNCLEYPIFILCGFVFPVDFLPNYVKPISYLLSPTWAIKVLRDSSLKITNYSMFYKEVGILCLICCSYIIISKLLFIRIDKNTRINATLGVS